MVPVFLFNFKKGCMELNEMVEMFQTNKILCEQPELVKLFFGEKYFPKDANPGLDFFQFMSFAISKKGDQDFRKFMRGVKEKLGKKEKLEEEDKSVKDAQTIISSSDYIKKHPTGKAEKIDEEEQVYLPMNFNKVLDYFNEKSNERNARSNLDKAIVKNFINSTEKNFLFYRF